MKSEKGPQTVRLENFDLGLDQTPSRPAGGHQCLKNALIVFKCLLDYVSHLG